MTFLYLDSIVLVESGYYMSFSSAHFFFKNIFFLALDLDNMGPEENLDTFPRSVECKMTELCSFFCRKRSKSRYGKVFFPSCVFFIFQILFIDFIYL